MACNWLYKQNFEDYPWYVIPWLLFMSFGLLISVTLFAIIMPPKSRAYLKSLSDEQLRHTK